MGRSSSKIPKPFEPRLGREPRETSGRTGRLQHEQVQVGPRVAGSVQNPGARADRGGTGRPRPSRPRASAARRSRTGASSGRASPRSRPGSSRRTTARDGRGRPRPRSRPGGPPSEEPTGGGSGAAGWLVPRSARRGSTPRGRWSSRARGTAAPTPPLPRCRSARRRSHDGFGGSPGPPRPSGRSLHPPHRGLPGRTRGRFGGVPPDSWTQKDASVIGSRRVGTTREYPMRFRYIFGVASVLARGSDPAGV